MTSRLNVDSIASKLGTTVGLSIDNLGLVSLTKAEILNANTVKTFINFDGQNNTILASLNISSTTDTYAGQYLYSYTSNMSSYAYGWSNTAGGNSGSLGDDSFGSTGQFNASNGTTTSSFKARYKKHDGSNLDASNASMLNTGDLA